MKATVVPLDTACWGLRIVCASGAVFRLCTYPYDVTMSNDEVYLAAPGYEASAVQQNSTMAASAIDIEGFVGMAGVTRAQIASGLFDSARVYIFRFDYLNPVEDDEPVTCGLFGKATLIDNRYRIEGMALIDALNQTVGRSYTAQCQHRFGDAKCGIYLSHMTVTGFLTRADNGFTFYDMTRVETPGRFTYGTIEFVTGPAAGLGQREIKAFENTRIETFEPFYFAPEIGDEYRMVPGCDKRRETCKTKFSNYINFGGFPVIPLNSVHVKVGFPGADDGSGTPQEPDTGTPAPPLVDGTTGQPGGGTATGGGWQPDPLDPAQKPSFLAGYKEPFPEYSAYYPGYVSTASIRAVLGNHILYMGWCSPGAPIRRIFNTNNGIFTQVGDDDDPVIYAAGEHLCGVSGNNYCGLQQPSDRWQNDYKFVMGDAFSVPTFVVSPFKDTQFWWTPPEDDPNLAENKHSRPVVIGKDGSRNLCIGTHGMVFQSTDNWATYTHNGQINKRVLNIEYGVYDYESYINQKHLEYLAKTSGGWLMCADGQNKSPGNLAVRDLSFYFTSDNNAVTGWAKKVDFVTLGGGQPWEGSNPIGGPHPNHGGLVFGSDIYGVFVSGLDFPLNEREKIFVVKSSNGGATWTLQAEFLASAWIRKCMSAVKLNGLIFIYSRNAAIAYNPSTSAFTEHRLAGPVTNVAWPHSNGSLVIMREESRYGYYNVFSADGTNFVLCEYPVP